MSEARTAQSLHQGQQVLTVGPSGERARAAMILLHGRGATAASILQLAQMLPHPDLVYLAPQAAGDTWYPHSFMVPIERNEPWLTSALAIVGDVVQQLEDSGIPADKVILSGFSQGACLAAEFAARQARRYGGLLVFSGGLIGPPGTPRDYPGHLDGTPVFLGCSDPDFHIPRERVEESAAVLAEMGGVVTYRLYPNIGHTIIQDEIDRAQDMIAALMARE